MIQSFRIKALYDLRRPGKNKTRLSPSQSVSGCRSQCAASLACGEIVAVLTLGVLDDFRIVGLHDGDAGVRGSQIDAHHATQKREFSSQAHQS